MSSDSEKLLGFVRAQVEERKSKQSKSPAFLDHLMEAKEKDGSPTYPDQSQIAAEARSLVVAGTHTFTPPFNSSTTCFRHLTPLRLRYDSKPTCCKLLLPLHQPRCSENSRR